jgi:hypothetical protein
VSVLSDDEVLALAKAIARLMLSLSNTETRLTQVEARVVELMEERTPHDD